MLVTRLCDVNTYLPSLSCFSLFACSSTCGCCKGKCVPYGRTYLYICVPSRPRFAVPRRSLATKQANALVEQTIAQSVALTTGAFLIYYICTYCIYENIGISALVAHISLSSLVFVFVFTDVRMLQKRDVYSTGERTIIVYTCVFSAAFAIPQRLLATKRVNALVNKQPFHGSYSQRTPIHFFFLCSNVSKRHLVRLAVHGRPGTSPV